jgi:hypothetical protein
MTATIMSRSAGTNRPSIWTGRALSGLFVLFMAFDVGIKVIDHPMVDQTMAALGFQAGVGRAIGWLELVLVALYLWPRTSVLGAVLLTGLFGGAMAAHIRVQDPWVSHTLFSIYLGLFMWGGLWLRDPGLRAVFPFRRAGAT